MGEIHIKDIDERVLTSLRLRARSNGRSFEDEIRAVLAEVGVKTQTPGERLAEIRRIRAMTPKGVAQSDSTDVVRELRDRGYAGR